MKTSILLTRQNGNYFQQSSTTIAIFQLILIVLTVLLLPTYVKAQTSYNAKTTSQRTDDVISVLNRHVSYGLPGATIAYSGKDTEFCYSTGYSNIEKKQYLTDSDMHYLQSTSKLYMATVIFKLAEERRLNIYDDISKHLDKRTIGGLSTKGITIKMLLNHTSGIQEYANDPQFVSFVLEHSMRPFKVQKCIDVVKNKPLNFAPATDYAYSNTNYTLLSLIADRITGNHVRYLNEKILRPNGLTETVYLTKGNYKSTKNIADSYWDVLNIEKPANVTEIQKANVVSLRGDDGIVCTSSDAIKFLKALMTGKILKPETVAYMQRWTVKDNQNRYGYGFEYYDLGSTYGIGHSGGGIGAGCVLMYLPELDSYVFMATNFTTLIDSKISRKCAGIQTEVLSALFM